MPFGSIFSKLEYIDLVTADDVHIILKNNFISRLAFKIIGLPHIGLRLRARKIVKYFINCQKILDAGCGTGVYSFSLANKVKEINAVDISQEKINHANQTNIFSNIKFKQGDITKLSFPDNYFDAIICSDVLEHIKNDTNAFSELSRVLKPKGRLLLTVPSNSDDNKRTYKKYGHERAGYTKEQIFTLSRKNYLVIEKSEGYSSMPTEIFSSLNYKTLSNKPLLAVIFYPLYVLSLISDLLFKKSYNGYFFLIRKI
jgi:ubiquinone/menaquinone biosynthesis C-methylase UbiE